MQWLDNLSLQAKLIVNFAVSGGVFVVAIVVCLWQIDRMSADTEHITRNWLPSIVQVEKMSRERLRYRVRSLEYLLPGTAEDRTKLGASLGSLESSVTQSIADYRPLVASPEEQKLLDDVARFAEQYRQSVAKAVALVQAGDEEGAQNLRRTEWVKEADQLRDALAALTKLNVEGAAADGANAQATTRAAKTYGIAALIIGVVVAALTSWLMARRMGLQLRSVVDAAGRIAKGDLRTPLPAASRDEVGQLVRAMANMQDALHSTLKQTSENASELSATARELGDGVASMQRNVALQGSASSSIAATVEELTVSIKHVSENTGDASRLAQDSDRQAREGRSTVDKLIEEINRVSEVVTVASQRIGGLESASQKISNIVQVIKEIAEQTNLLALNAAIEAARAGEHGRGFAVVADEVRKLSERTSHSTGEITGMVNEIQDSTRQAVAGIDEGVAAVTNSVGHARLAGETIGALQDIARRVADLVGEVDNALREQATASAEVAKQVEEISSHAAETESATAQALHSAQTLNSVAGNMVETVRRFHL
ncbi:methyl-accepting chemotaxis protein [Azoarcus olearius]|uniref:Ribose and galactose chemoreceptor protein n=1 Tax=Azoarcus sp. (strain BH72) TaxID=418699 RepID=A1K7I3_AZOSB|nr:methyl-accepting chemotaxis protein [Azoarcus olearius]ANQ85335.1 putative ribose and galactose chemoreceptor protein [Azoarcus olearius]CAL94788.1 putative ribose and galactose chemoreceptor protein [Azoarcus olearius]